MSSLPDYYRILGVSRTASTRELKAAYRRLALRYHPDLHPNNPRAEEVLKIINQAYDVLSDAQQRRQYDAQIVSQGYTPPTTTWTAPPRPATPTRSQRAWPYSDFTPYPTARPGNKNSTFHLKTVLLMWMLGLLIIVGFAAMFRRGPVAPVTSNPWPIELVLRTPERALLFASSTGALSTQESYVQREPLRMGEKMTLQYRVQASQGRVFIGLKGQSPEPGSAAPFADGEWIARTGTGTLEVIIPRSDSYVIFLNLDNFAGVVRVNPEKK